MATRAGAGLVGRFLGNAVSEAAAFAAGVALGPVLGPPVQALRNEVNAAFPFVPIGPGTLAEGVSQGQIGHDLARDIAAHSGVNADNFDRMVTIANVGPGSGTAFELWRRGVIDEPGFRRAVKRLGLEQEWIDDLVKIKGELLAPADLARAIHRGLVPDPGLLRGEQPSGEGKIPAYPVYPIDALAEALGSGIDHDRLGVLVGLQGNPMGAHEAAEALFRGILDDNDYLRAIAEGNTRNEWAQAIKDQTRQIPTARDFFENALRGYHNLAWAQAQAKRHGMSDADSLVIYQNQGRPMNVHAIQQALARGAKFHPEQGEITDPFDAAIVEGNLKPAYYELAKSLRYTLPSVFVMRTLAESGVWSEAKTAERLKWAGWFEPDADEAAAAWVKPKTTSAKENPYVAKAENQLWTALHKQYVKYGAARAAVEPIMAEIIADAAARDHVFRLWDAERQTQALPAAA